ncbi:hypothetical protein B0T22DRAFT_457156 [Podospora appendiculata]|uniref:DUF7730 domain-containing protein n=1 Tax=Podospora appendiculata TaxID=314037 RepID=A0AAE0X7B2_9PEZI|nr:hypothetical protein B0T22DRAFT_457156 [Podospora appendiculata]
MDSSPPITSNMEGAILPSNSGGSSSDGNNKSNSNSLKPPTPPIPSLTDHIAATADPQSQSHFFSKLPAEIRESIYVEVWRTAGSLRYHILTRDDDDYGTTQGVAHRACITASLAGGGDDDDRRLAKTHRDFAPRSRELGRWRRSLRAHSGAHWMCAEAAMAEAAAGCQSGSSSSFLATLLSCKRLYAECKPSIYAALTFILADLQLAGRFLAQHQHQPIRSLELCIRAPNLLTELYYPVPPGAEGTLHVGPAFAFPGRPALSEDNNPWAHVCDLLLVRGGGGDLRDLRIWFDSTDLRPWQDRVSETRLFAKLFGVRVGGGSTGTRSRGGFVLMLPNIPRQEKRRLGEEHFLEGERVRDAPFVVVRGARPDNWEGHLAGRRVGAVPVP